MPVSAAARRPSSTSRKARRGAALLAAAACAATGLVAAPAGSAQAADQVVRPAQGGLVIVGKGFGHGRGMSQWGAYGAAESGLRWTQILDFYYPGTVRAKAAGSSMRVWISGDDDKATNVVPATGLTVTSGRTKRVLPVGAGYRQWRAVASGATMRVQFLDAAGTWRPYAVPAAATVVFSAPSGLVRVVRPDSTVQELRGAVQSNVTAGTVRTVLATSMQSYLRSVVPNEMPSNWHTEALAAQTVAARTYAASYRANQQAKGAPYDICDSTACQVFDGVARYSKSGALLERGESARSDAAVTATDGIVLKTSAKPDAKLVWAEFSASNGGYSVAGGPSYQVAKPDPYDGKLANPSTAWTKGVSAATLAKAFGLGTLTDVQVLQRDGLGALGGRVSSMRLNGTARSVTVSGAKLRAVLGLKSDWFTLVDTQAVAANTLALVRAGLI